MAKKALIKITGKQIYGPDHDDSIELTTIGTLEETDDTYIIRYKEQQQADFGKTEHFKGRKEC